MNDYLKNRKKYIGYAQKMRHNPTPAECFLWDKLKNKALRVRFIRQHVIFGRIADFCAPSIRLIVEVDGGYHLEQKDKDVKRDEQLKRQGYTTMRFTNDQVMKETDLVVIKILAFIVFDHAEIISLLEDYMQGDRSMALSESAGKTDKCDDPRYKRAAKMVEKLREEGDNQI